MRDNPDADYYDGDFDQDLTTHRQHRGSVLKPKSFMQNNDKTYTVAEVALLADESWINGSLEAFVLKLDDVPKRAGGSFTKATLGDKPGDYTNCVTMSLFAAPRFAVGDRIRLGGGGIKKTSYQGKPQIGMGKSSTTEVVRVGGERIQAAMDRSPAPNGSAPASSPGPSVIHGATVGNAVKETFRALTHGLSPQELAEDLQAPEFWERLKMHASSFIRVSQELESGNLSEKPEDQIRY